jgi:hypothetical protein
MPPTLVGLLLCIAAARASAAGAAGVTVVGERRFLSTSRGEGQQCGSVGDCSIGLKCVPQAVFGAAGSSGICRTVCGSFGPGGDKVTSGCNNGQTCSGRGGTPCTGQAGECFLYCTDDAGKQEGEQCDQTSLTCGIGLLCVPPPASGSSAAYTCRRVCGSFGARGDVVTSACSSGQRCSGLAARPCPDWAGECALYCASDAVRSERQQCGVANGYFYGDCDLGLECVPSLKSDEPGTCRKVCGSYGPSGDRVTTTCSGGQACAGKVTSDCHIGRCSLYCTDDPVKQRGQVCGTGSDGKSYGQCDVGLECMPRVDGAGDSICQQVCGTFGPSGDMVTGSCNYGETCSGRAPMPCKEWFGECFLYCTSRPPRLEGQSCGNTGSSGNFTNDCAIGLECAPRVEGGQLGPYSVCRKVCGHFGPSGDRIISACMNGQTCSGRTAFPSCPKETMDCQLYCTDWPYKLEGQNCGGSSSGDQFYGHCGEGFECVPQRSSSGSVINAPSICRKVCGTFGPYGDRVKSLCKYGQTCSGRPNVPCLDWNDECYLYCTEERARQEGEQCGRRGPDGHFYSDCDIGLECVPPMDFAPRGTPNVCRKVCGSFGPNGAKVTSTCSNGQTCLGREGVVCPKTDRDCFLYCTEEPVKQEGEVCGRIGSDGYFYSGCDIGLECVPPTGQVAGAPNTCQKVCGSFGALGDKVTTTCRNGQTCSGRSVVPCPAWAGECYMYCTDEPPLKEGQQCGRAGADGLFVTDCAIGLQCVPPGDDDPSGTPSYCRKVCGTYGPNGDSVTGACSSGQKCSGRITETCPDWAPECYLHCES